MTHLRILFVLTLGMLLASCAIGQPAISLPTPTSTVALPTAPLVVAVSPTATSTPRPPTPTATATAIATATLTPTLTPTSTATPTRLPTATLAALPAFLMTNDTPPLPPGKGGLIINNHFGVELNYDLGGKVYQVPPNSRMIIFLAAGKYTFTASAVGYASKSGATEVLDGYYRNQDWG